MSVIMGVNGVNQIIGAAYLGAAGANEGWSFSGAKLNVFAQPDEPATKDGIWLQTAAKETLKKVIFDANPWAAGSWLNPSDVPALPSAYYDTLCIPWGEDFYFFGGFNNQNSPIANAFKYNTATKTYTTIKSLPVAAACMFGLNYNGILYLFGGEAGSGCHTNAFSYNPVTNDYTYLTEMPSKIARASCCVYDGSIYILGGHGDSGVTGNVWKYNITANSYSSLATMTDDYRYNFGCILYGTDIYIFGGYSGGSTTNKACKYSIVSNSYTALPTLPRYLGYAVTCLIGNKIQMYGGYDSKKGVFNDIVEYSLETNTYTILSNSVMNTARQYACGGQIGNFVYIFGGKGSPGVLNTVECYALASKQYTSSPAAIIHRLSKDTTYQATLVSTKLCDGIPTNFKDAMLFKDGNLAYPALYIGDGTTWTKKREAQ